MAGDVDQRLGLLAVRAQLAVGHDVGFAGMRRVKPVGVDAAAPAAQRGAVALLAAVGVAEAKGFDFLDVRGVGLQGHGVESMRALNVPQTILCPARRSANQDLPTASAARSEEHTSELQSHSDIVCRLLLEKKKDQNLESRIARLELDSS